MNYGRIIERDSTNGVGIRVTLFVSGCTHCCEGCFQPETWDFNYGKEFNESTEEYIIELLKPEYIKGLTILGGDPLEINNQLVLYPFIKRLKNIYPNKTIWIYTGCIFEKLFDNDYKYHCDITESLLNNIDVIIDGPFIQNQSSMLLKFKGSSNQRLINVKESIKLNKTILYE